MPEVELRHVACAPALADVSVELAPGVCALVGRNAAGKSTLLRIIAGLRRPDSGTVRVRGAIGCVLDGVGAHPSHSVTRHLRWVGALGGVDKRRVAEVLEWSGLADVAHAQVRTLSTGLRARLDVAAAALTDPPILLLDEPLNGMDVAAVWWMREVLATWREEGKNRDHGHPCPGRGGAHLRSGAAGGCRADPGRGLRCRGVGAAGGVEPR